MYDDKLFQSEFFFSSKYLNRNDVLSLHLDLRITLSLQYRKFLPIVCLSLILKSSKSLPKHGKTKSNSFLRTIKLKSFLINNLFKKNFIH